MYGAISSMVCLSWLASSVRSLFATIRTGRDQACSFKAVINIKLYNLSGRSVIELKNKAVGKISGEDHFTERTT
jgi:hypothetical protein